MFNDIISMFYLMLDFSGREQTFSFSTVSPDSLDVILVLVA